MTPLTNIENGILSGNWNLVCKGFNKLTGKNLSAPIPIVATLENTFDVDTASKRELYKYLKGFIDPEPMKSYSTEELREMASIYSMGDLEDIVEEVVDVVYPVKKDNGFTKPFKSPEILPNGGQFLDGFRYHSGKKKLLPIDRIKVKAVIDPQLKNVGDPTADYTPREPTEKVKNTCLKCSKVFTTYKGIGVDVDGELKSLCPICSETP